MASDAALPCLHCQRVLEPEVVRLWLRGSVSWTARPGVEAEGPEQVLSGDAQFCSIRCFGTFIGVTLEKRGLIAPKQRT